MELFEKIYNCYYDVINRILIEARKRPVTEKDMAMLSQAYGFLESALTIVPKLSNGCWPFLKQMKDGAYSSRLAHDIRPPLTIMQKRWLSSLLKDPRFQLFFHENDRLQLEKCFDGIEPLFYPEDFHYFDTYQDGDPYDNEDYRSHFHSILAALSQNRPLMIAYEGKNSATRAFEVMPYQLQYSSKDDKFRLCCLLKQRERFSRNTLLNLAKIKDCHLLSPQVTFDSSQYRFHPIMKAPEPVLLKISGERNSLERCMLHFANYEKHTEYDEEKKCWICSIYYDLADETELLIDILSFGPVVQVLGPEPFLAQVRERVRKQHHLLFHPVS